jgi:hypothetical protein
VDGGRASEGFDEVDGGVERRAHLVGGLPEVETMVVVVAVEGSKIKN